MRKADTGAAEPICVPKEAFKYISSAETYDDGKRVMFIGPQGIFYISLIVVAMDMPKLDTKQICAVAADKKQFIDTLKCLEDIHLRSKLFSMVACIFWPNQKQTNLTLL